MIRIAYFFIGLILLPFLVIGALLTPRGRDNFLERLGLWSHSDRQPVVWLHGASLGEIRGLFPLLKKLKEGSTASASNIIVTTTTSSGRKALTNQNYTSHLLPFDWEPLYSVAFGNKTLSLCIISETEIWPGMLWYLRRRNVPIIIVNARISDASWKRYRIFGRILAPLLNQCQKFLVADETSFERYKELGVEVQKLSLCGNTKYDLEPSIKNDRMKTELKAKFFRDKNYIITLGSLRPGEEEYWFNALRDAQKKGFLTNIGVVIAPRHPEKFEHFKEALSARDLQFECWSAIKERKASELDIVVLDTLGELESVYAFSQIAFIGGTLKEYGGHNPIEAANYGAAIVMGPSDFAVRDIVRELERVGGILKVESEEAILRMIEKFTLNPSLFEKVGMRGEQLATKLRGATERALQVVGDYLA